jgi:ABC-2 type transport system ATP-binding protein
VPDRLVPHIAVECRDLVVRYGTRTAVDGLSFTASSGQVVALLGPNGAGKTTTVETLEGYRHPDSGSVRVLGLDPRRDDGALAPRIGVMLQRGGVYPAMGPKRALELFASYYAGPEDPAALLTRVGLDAVARTPWRRLSGGEQQRLALALALVGRPEVVFLDEPTAGVDPEGRLVIRAVVAELAAAGTCVILTTHELTEAERMADEVLIVAAGKAVTRGTLAELSAGTGEGIQFTAPTGLEITALATALGVGPGAVSEPSPGRYAVTGPATAERVAALAAWLTHHDLPLIDFKAGTRSLEDVYLSATRRAAAPGDAAQDPEGAP